MKKLLLLIIAVLLFSSCAAPNGDAGDERLPEVQSPQRNVLTLSEALNGRKTVWLRINDGEKLTSGAKVSTIYVFDGDQTAVYSSSADKTLGQLEEMTDDRIADMTKENYENDMSYYLTVGFYYTLPEKEQFLQGFGLSALRELLADNVTVENSVVLFCGDENLAKIASDSVCSLLREKLPALSEKLKNADSDKILEALQYVQTGQGFADALRSLVPEISEQSLTADIEVYDDAVGLLDGIYPLLEDAYNALSAQVEQSRQSISASQYRLSLITDQNGNISNMQLALHTLVPPYDNIFSLVLSETAQKSEIKIGNSYYAGYAGEGYMLYTRSDGKTDFVLDDASSPLPVNSDSSLLFE